MIVALPVIIWKGYPSAVQCRLSKSNLFCKDIANLRKPISKDISVFSHLNILFVQTKINFGVPCVPASPLL